MAGARDPGLAELLKPHSLREVLSLTAAHRFAFCAYLRVLFTRNRLSQHVLDKRTELCIFRV